MFIHYWQINIFSLNILFAFIIFFILTIHLLSLSYVCSLLFFPFYIVRLSPTPFFFCFYTRFLARLFLLMCVDIFLSVGGMLQWESYIYAMTHHCICANVNAIGHRSSSLSIWSLSFHLSLFIPFCSLCM